MDEIIGNQKNTAQNAEIISEELAVIMFKVKNREGAHSQFLSDSTMALDISAALENLKNSSANLDDNFEAVKKSWLLRGAVKKMEKEEKEKENKK